MEPNRLKEIISEEVERVLEQESARITLAEGGFEFEGKLTEAKNNFMKMYPNSTDLEQDIVAWYRSLKKDIGEKFAKEMRADLVKALMKESKLTEAKLARGLKPLLVLGSKITKKVGEDVLVKLSDKFDRIDDEYAGDIASHLDMAIELMQDGYPGDATKKLKQFNKACKDVLKGKSIKSAFAEGKLTEASKSNLKKGDKFKSTQTGEILFIIEPKGDGYDYRMSSDPRSKTHAPKAWFDMMIKTGKLVAESVLRGQLAGDSALDMAGLLRQHGVKKILKQPNSSVTYLQLTDKSKGNKVVAMLKKMFGIKAQIDNHMYSPTPAVKFDNDQIAESKLTEAAEEWTVYVDGKKIKTFNTKRGALVAYNKIVNGTSSWEKVTMKVGSGVHESKLTEALQADIFALQREMKKDGLTEAELEFGVEYRDSKGNPKKKGSPIIMRYKNKASADKFAKKGNQIDKVGGKYTVVRVPMEESKLTEAKPKPLVSKKDIKNIENSGNIDIAYKKAMALLKSLSEGKLTEAMDMNDPILIAIRARKTMLAKEKSAPKQKKISMAQYYKLMDKEIDLINDIKNAYKDYERLDSEMNQDAGQKGKDWTDADANRYGANLDKLQTKIEKLAKLKLAVKKQIMNYRMS